MLHTLGHVLRGPVCDCVSALRSWSIFVPGSNTPLFIECHPTHTEPFVHSNHFKKLRGSEHILRECISSCQRSWNFFTRRDWHLLILFWFIQSWSFFMPRDWHPVGWHPLHHCYWKTITSPFFHPYNIDQLHCLETLHTLRRVLRWPAYDYVCALKSWSMFVQGSDTPLLLMLPTCTEPFMHSSKST